MSPIVQKHLVDVLEVRMGDYNTRIFGIQSYTNDDLARVLSLLDESHVLGYGIGVDVKEHPLDQFTIGLLNEATRPVVVDGQVTGIVARNISLIRPQTKLIIVLNLKEINVFFGTPNPNDVQLSERAQQLGCFLVLKGENTRIVDSDGNIESIYTGGYPQMTMAGAGDVLLGLVTGFIAQGK